MMDINSCFNNIGIELEKLRKIMEEKEISNNTTFLSESNPFIDDIYFCDEKSCKKDIDNIAKTYFFNESEENFILEMIESEKFEFEITFEDIFSFKENYNNLFERYFELICDDEDINSFKDILENIEENEENVRNVLTFFENIIQGYIYQFLLNRYEDTSVDINPKELIYILMIMMIQS